MNRICKNIFLNIFILACTLVLCSSMPSQAKFRSSISKGHYFDVKQTLMPEAKPDLTLTTEKYWERNLLELNQYRPLFMLSNADIIDFSQKPKPRRYVSKVYAPSIYNVSFKEENHLQNSRSTAMTRPYERVFRPVSSAEATQQDAQMRSLYKTAKAGSFDSEKLIDTAIILKNSSKFSNYTFALDLLDNVIKKEPYNAYAYYVKGEVYSAKNDSELAMKNYLQALKLNPYSKKSYLGIAKILEPTNSVLAQKYYEKAR